MKIEIDSKEIGEAVTCYLNKQGVNVESYDLSFNVVAGRNDVGPRIEIALERVAEPVLDTEEVTAEVLAAPFGSKED